MKQVKDATQNNVQTDAIQDVIPDDTTNHNTTQAETSQEPINLNLLDIDFEEFQKTESSNTIIWANVNSSRSYLSRKFKEPFAYARKDGFGFNIEVIQLIEKFFEGNKTYDFGYSKDLKAIILKPSPTGIPVHYNLEKSYYANCSCRRFMTVVMELDTDLQPSWRYKVFFVDLPFIGKCLVIHLAERLV